MNKKMKAAFVSAGTMYVGITVLCGVAEYKYNDRRTRNTRRKLHDSLIIAGLSPVVVVDLAAMSIEDASKVLGEYLRGGCLAISDVACGVSRTADRFLERMING